MAGGGIYHEVAAAYYRDTYVSRTHLVDPPALDAESVLVDGDDLPVLQDGLVVGLEGAQVDRHEQRRSEDGPHRHLSLALLVAEAEVADDELKGEENILSSRKG